MSIKRPSQGFIFWPVGNGDSTTFVINNDTTLQLDLNHLECSGQDDDPHCPIIDELKTMLPKKGGKPYLSVFVLSHPDQDHCRGFKRLLDEVSIGELWFTPRVFNEYKKDLCDDAVAFRDEANRRVKKVIKSGNDVTSGDRVRIIGYSDILDEDDFKGFPKDLLTVPGNSITDLDGLDHSDEVRVFVHAPFKDDAYGERNESSVAVQVSLTNGEYTAQSLHFGDLSYPTLKRIFEVSEEDDLAWDVLQAPHHCSKDAMYWQDEDSDEETLHKDILDAMEAAMGEIGYIVASSEPVPSKNKTGDNPPHAAAKARYEEIAASGFLCTQGASSAETPEPLVFEVTGKGLEIESQVQESASSIEGAIQRARGIKTPPQDAVGFGS